MPEIVTDRNGEREVGQFLRDLWLLMKPELTLLSVFTSLCSAYLAIDHPHEVQLLIFPFLALGTLLVGGGAGALNQYHEREFDGMMKRTEKRPIPDQRITPNEALVFGTFAGIIGVIILSMINLLTGFLSAVTLVSYVFLYTPLKRISTLSTIIGAIPGALPTLIGWAAIQNSLSYQSLTLFAILFYWQMPHFYSINWLYRHDYSKAGFRFLASFDGRGERLARHVLLNQMMLLLVVCSPAAVGIVSLEYLAVAIPCCAVFFFFGVRFFHSVGTETSGSAARALFFSSLFFLPVIFSSMIIFKIHPFK